MILLRIVCDVNMKNLKILLLLPDVVARWRFRLICKVLMIVSVSTHEEIM